MTSHEGHREGCYVSTAVRFAKPGQGMALGWLAAGAVNGVIGQCKRAGAIPDGLISVAVGPCRDLVGLWERVSAGAPVSVQSVGAADQVGATLKGEPERFAALAFAHVVPDGGS